MLDFDLNKLLQTINLGNQYIDVLRLDTIDSHISGNKWFKLKYHIEDAIQLGATEIHSFGGVWSNHIAAFSSACHLYKIPNTIYVRSDEQIFTHTLITAQANGSTIKFVTRAEYKSLKLRSGIDHKIYYVPEGGNTVLGINGAAEITKFNTWKTYTHIACSVGTGATASGIAQHILINQKLLLFNALKNNYQPNFENLNASNWEVFNQFHFGGFAKYDYSLLSFMNECYKTQHIPTDFVYTGKLLYGIHNLITENYFSFNNKILIIHTGGLQGNKSLTENELIF